MPTSGGLLAMKSPGLVVDSKPSLEAEVCLVTTKLKEVSRAKGLIAEFSSAALGLKKGG